MVPEWSDCSIAYEEMKTFLYGAAAMRTLTPAGSNLSLIDTQPFLRTEDIFFEVRQYSSDSISEFYDQFSFAHVKYRKWLDFSTVSSSSE